MGVSRATASKWVNRYRDFGDIGLLDRSSVPLRQSTATSGVIIRRIEWIRHEHKWSMARITFELAQEGTHIGRRTVTRMLGQLGLSHRRFIDPTGETNREPRRIIAERPGHMIHIDVKKVGRIPDGGGWRIHGMGSPQAKAVDRTKKRGSRTGYVYLHSAIDGYSRLAYTEALDDEKAVTAVEHAVLLAVFLAVFPGRHRRARPATVAVPGGSPGRTTLRRPPRPPRSPAGRTDSGRRRVPARGRSAVPTAREGAGPSDARSAA